MRSTKISFRKIPNPVACALRGRPQCPALLPPPGLRASSGDPNLLLAGQFGNMNDNTTWYGTVGFGTFAQGVLGAVYCSLPELGTILSKRASSGGILRFRWQEFGAWGVRKLELSRREE